MRITLICADDDRWAIGLRTISSALTEAGHATRLIFLAPSTVTVTSQALKSIVSLGAQSDLFGVSSMSRGSGNAKAIIGGLKPLGKPIAWGGMHPTLYPQDCVDHADVVCRGEGEEFMVELAERLESGRGFHDIRNGAVSRCGRMLSNGVRPPIADLDRLPIPDFSSEEEFTVSSGGGSLRASAIRNSSSVLLTGSRGCLYSCHYCSNAQLKVLYAGMGPLARKTSVSRFIEQVDACRRSFPKVRHFYFTDEDFFARPVDEIRQFAQDYPRSVGVPFECMASPQQITEEKTSWLVKAGMWRVDIGVESGSDRIRRTIYHRPVSSATVLRAAAIVNGYPQLVAYYFFIIGNPYETRDDLLDTIGMIRRLPCPCFVRTYSLVFIPGTRLFEKAREDGIIQGLGDSGYEIDFLAGLDHRRHAWKQKNLYLDGLISLMTGKAKPHRVGFVPRRLLPALVNPRWLDLNYRHAILGKIMIVSARWGRRARRVGFDLVSRVLRNPGTIHNPSSLRSFMERRGFTAPRFRRRVERNSSPGFQR